jgi:PhnB protein
MRGNNAKSPQSRTTVAIFLYTEDVDHVFKQAVSGGAKLEMSLDDMFWGDRYGKVSDPFGHSWSLATHKEDVATEKMKKRAKEAMAKMEQHAHTVA